MNNKDTIVIHPYLKSLRVQKGYFLKEAINLVKAINLNCLYSHCVGLEKISPKTYLNTGFIFSLIKKKEELNVDLIYINTNLIF